MNNLIRRFLGALSERILASIASTIGSTFSTFRAIQHAEQQSALEDLARQYESEGKTDVAENLRVQAARLSHDDPGTEARLIFQNVLGDHAHSPALTDQRQAKAAEPDPEPKKPRSKPAKKKGLGKKPAEAEGDWQFPLD